jgi:hypothetical protein
MMTPLRIAWFGSSLVSAYWNGAATYYRGIIRALADRGHQVEFFEPDAFERQAHRDMDDPDWARVTCFEPTEPAAAACLERARRADVIIKSSGIGVLDGYLEREIALARGFSTQTVLWDVDAPATLASLAANPDAPLRRHVGDYDWVLTYGGGPPVVAAYEALGVRRCIPIYNALDASTHYRVPPRDEFAADLSFLANRLPDRENRVREFFFDPIKRLPASDSCWAAAAGRARTCRRRTSGGSGTSTRATTMSSIAVPWPCSTCVGTAWPVPGIHPRRVSSKPPEPAPASSAMPGPASSNSWSRAARYWWRAMAPKWPNTCPP